MLRALVFAGAMLAMALSSLRAHGEPVTFYFGGMWETSSVEGAVAGEAFSGSYTFSSLAADSATSLNRGSYPDAISAFSVAGVMSSSEGSMDVTNGSPDSYGIVVPVEMPLFGTRPFSMSLIDQEGTAFLSDVLPVVPPTLADFEVATLGISIPFVGDALRGQITYLSLENPFATAVPEPQTYALLLAGLGLLAFAARRRL